MKGLNRKGNTSMVRVSGSCFDRVRIRDRGTQDSLRGARTRVL